MKTETVLVLISEVSRLSDDKVSLAAHVELSVCVGKKEIEQERLKQTL